MYVKFVSMFENIESAEMCASRINKTILCNEIIILFPKASGKEPFVFYESNVGNKSGFNEFFAFNGAYSKFFNDISDFDLKAIEYKSDSNKNFEIKDTSSCALEIIADYAKIESIEKIIRNMRGYNVTFNTF